MKVEDYLKHVNMHVTDEIRKFVEDYVFSNSEYMFFSKDKCYCSRCKTELKPVKFVKLTHNDGTICPICGTKLIAKNTKFGRKNCLNEACFYYFEKSITDPKVVVCKGYYVEKDYFIDYENPRYRYELCAVYIFKEKEAVMLKHNYWYDSWEKRSSIFDFNNEWFANKMCYCSFESIGTAIKDTAFQYMPYEIFQGHYSMVKVFDEYIKYPWIEQICKAGFTNIIEAKLSGYSLFNCLNYKGKNIFEILRLNRKDLREIRESKVKITPMFLRIYQFKSKSNSKLSVKEIVGIENEYGYHGLDLVNIFNFVSLKKTFSYVNKQFKKYPKNYINRNDVITTWSDYIKDCKKLRMNLKSEHVLFPKDVYQAHQNTIKQIFVKANKDLDKKILKRAETLEKFAFQFNGLLIRPARSTEDMISEGQAMENCVASNYTKRYANGGTNIFFIRKIDNPGISYCTVEIKDNEIVQARIKRNHVPGQDIKEFLEMFKKVKLNESKPMIEKVRISA